MKNTLKYITNLLLVAIVVFSCSEDDSIAEDPFVIAFAELSKNIDELTTDNTFNIVYSKTANANGSFSISINDSGLTYGIDYTTIPEAVDDVINLPINLGEINNAIQFQKLSNNYDENTEIVFAISQIDYVDSNIQGYSTLTLNSSDVSLGGSIQPEVGGPNEGNQVYVDLSSNTTTVVQRDSWDLGFYGGVNFRVAINGSIYMATAALSQTNIDAVSQADVASLQTQVAVGTFNPQNAEYVDAPNGSILETAINEISENDAENPVYLVNLGYEVGTNTPTTGSVAIAGDARGWKKIRVLRDGNNYVLQYADLNDTAHQEVTISKNSNYNFTFFSFNTNNIVNVEPQKQKWDICFSVFTNVLNGAGSYGFSDFVFHNRKGDTQTYLVDENEGISYENFSFNNINENNLLDDQTTIGSSWRSVFSGSVHDDKFYIIKDPNGNYYKLKFLALTNPNGERGYPEFTYALLTNQ